MRNIYVKLGVHRHTKACERARELELLAASIAGHESAATGEAESRPRGARPCCIGNRIADAVSRPAESLPAGSIARTV